MFYRNVFKTVYCLSSNVLTYKTKRKQYALTIKYQTVINNGNKQITHKITCKSE